MRYPEVFLFPCKHVTFKSTRDKHRKLHTGCLPSINIITSNKAGPKVWNRTAQAAFPSSNRTSWLIFPSGIAALCSPDESRPRVGPRGGKITERRDVQCVRQGRWEYCTAICYQNVVSCLWRRFENVQPSVGGIDCPFINRLSALDPPPLSVRRPREMKRFSGNRERGSERLLFCSWGVSYLSQSGPIKLLYSPILFLLSFFSC